MTSVRDLEDLGEAEKGHDRSRVFLSTSKEEATDESGGAAAPPAAGIVDEEDPDAIYRRFSGRRKHFITAQVSFAAFLAPFASSCFFPSIPEIAEAVSTSAEVINYTVSIYLAVLGAAPLIWAPLSGYWGRRIVYLVSLPLFIAGSVGCALCNDLPSLIGTRILQGIGSSAVLAVGAGTIGDIFGPLERATAMGLFYLGAVMGPAFAPVVAGVLQEYTKPGWRSMQWLLAAAGTLSVTLIFFFLPETWHGPTPHELAQRRTGRRFVFYWFNPFTSVRLLAIPNVLLISLNSSFTLMTAYVMLIPLTYTVAPRYGVTNIALVGLLFLPQGLGNVAGSRLGGILSDRAVARWIVERGYRRPEDRLHSTLIGSGLILPISMIAGGWLMETGKGGIVPPLICLFISGFALMLILSSSNTYCVDFMQTRSAEIIAINNFMRYMIAAAAVAGILPLIKKVGVGAANTIAAAIGFIGFLFVLAIIRWGEGWAGRSAPPLKAEEAQTTAAAVEDSAGSSVKESVSERDVVGELSSQQVVQTRARAGTIGEGCMPDPKELLARTLSSDRGTL